MTASSVLVIYDALSLQTRRIVVCDCDAQTIDSNSSYKLNVDEAALLIPLTTYQSYTDSSQIAAAVAAAYQ